MGKVVVRVEEVVVEVVEEVVVVRWRRWWLRLGGKTNETLCSRENDQRGALMRNILHGLAKYEPAGEN